MFILLTVKIYLSYEIYISDNIRPKKTFKGKIGHVAEHKVLV